MDDRGFIEAISGAWKVLHDKPRVQLIPPIGELLVIGDLHGDQNSIKKILKKEKANKRLDNGSLNIAFLGDYVDRGPDSMGTLFTVCELVCQYPDQVYPLRGNHEGPTNAPAMPSTFYDFIKSKHPEDNEVLYQVRRLFSSLKVAAIIPDYAFLVHGHIPSDAASIDAIMELEESDPLLLELLWNDPAITLDTKPSFRGHGYYVGTDAVENFLQQNKLKWIIRGHEKTATGYELLGKTLTIHTTGPKTTYLRIPLINPGDPVEYIKQI